MLSSVSRTPRGVRAGSPPGNPSTGRPATWRPRTADRALSAKVRESGCCFANLGDCVLEGKRKGCKEGLGVGEELDWDIWLCIFLLRCPVLTILIGWMILKLPGVEEMVMGVAWNIPFSP